jgi:hypothetical protein
MRSPIIFTGAIAVLLAGALLARPLSGAAADQAELAKPVFAEKLSNVPGKTLTEIVVTYASGARSAKHHQAGSGFPYVPRATSALRTQRVDRRESITRARRSLSLPRAGI